MELYLDHGDPEVIERILRTWPIDGFTTNPNLLAKTKRDAKDCFRAYRGITRETELRIFVQVTSKDAEGMAREGRKLRDFFGGNLVVKVPAVAEGYRACGILKREGIPVCVTVIHSVNQALLAAKCGADYAAPYVSHIDNNGADGPDEVGQMVRIFSHYGYPTKVLGASFRTALQIRRLAEAGCHAVTITPEFFDLLIAHPSTDHSLSGFDRVWRERFGDLSVSDLIPGEDEV